jgi:eukaryotic-like serine/threonine-protein kinase
MRNGVFQLFRAEPDGTHPEEQLTHGSADNYLTDWSRDGKYLLYVQGSPGAFDMWAKRDPELGAESRDVPVLRTASDEVDGQFSPDGKWIAYSSNATGRHEIYIMGFSPNIGEFVGRWQISNGGGRAPRWRGDGQELYYLTADNKLMAVTIRHTAKSLQPETPHELFSISVPADSGDNPFPYDVMGDGKRFLLEENAGTEASVPLTVVVNWQAGLKK